MSRKRNVQDPVWGRIDLEDEEWAVIQHPLFQRLRRVHQLGLTMLVYPGATHTRFEHSIGTSHVAGLLADRLMEVDRGHFGVDDRRLARLAGLLHDIGHGPYSHVSDVFLGPKGHELIGAMFVESDPQLVSDLGQETCSAIGQILRLAGPRTVVRDIVSGPADADKIDYLNRDSHFAGVQQGCFDHVRCIDQAVVITSGPNTFLGFQAGGLWAVEGMLLARHHMHQTVYGHRNRLITDFMLQRGLEAALGQGLIPTVLLERPKEGNLDGKLAAYRDWDDWSVATACHGKGGVAGEMFDRLREHRLLKLLVALQGEELSEALGFPANRNITGADLDKLGPAIESTVARAINHPPELVFVRIDDSRRPLGRPVDPSISDQDINFVMPDGRIEPLEKHSEVFGQLDSRNRTRLLIYGEQGRKANPELAEKAKTAAIDALRDRLTGGAE